MAGHMAGQRQGSFILQKEIIMLPIRLALLLLVVAINALQVVAQQAPPSFVVAFHLSLPAPLDLVRFNITRALAPLGVDRLYQLLTLPGGSYYANNAFFRVVPGFVVQFGISSVPAIAQQWENANIDDDPVLGSNTMGTICFATAGPNTRTTQLYINYADNKELDSQGAIAIVEGCIKFP